MAPIAPTDDLKLEQRGHVLVVTLDREARMNALSQALHDGLPKLWNEVRGDRSIRANGMRTSSTIDLYSR